MLYYRGNCSISAEIKREIAQFINSNNIPELWSQLAK
jgi:hypothetical protein